MDDVIIWLDTLEDHQQHVDMVMKALQKAHLYLNLKKCHFFLTEVDFLGHHISAHGIEPQSAKCDKILNGPSPPQQWMFIVFWGLFAT